MRAAAIRRYTAVAESAAHTMQLALQDAAPLGETGETRRQITVTPGGGVGNTLAYTATAPTKQGQYVEEGTTAVDIVPVQAKALRFAGGSGRISQPAPNQRIATRAGGVVFAMRVHKLAQPPRPWFAPVIARWSDFLAQALANA